MTLEHRSRVQTLHRNCNEICILPPQYGSLSFAQSASEVAEYNVQSMFYELEHRAPFQPQAQPTPATAPSSTPNGDSTATASAADSSSSSTAAASSSARDTASASSAELVASAPSKANEQSVAEPQMNDSQRAQRPASAESGTVDGKSEAPPKQSPSAASPADENTKEREGKEVRSGPDSGSTSTAAAASNGAQQWSSDPDQYGMRTSHNNQ